MTDAAIAGRMRCYEGVLAEADRGTHTTWHAVHVNNWQVRSIDSDRIGFRLDGHAPLFRLRSLGAGQLFLGAGDRLRVAGVEDADGVTVYGIRNLADGSVYATVPVDSVSAATRHILPGIAALAGIVVTGAMLWQGTAGRSDYLEVAGVTAAMAGLFYLIGWLGRRIGLDRAELGPHANRGGDAEMSRALDLLEVAPGAAVFPL
ncbi:hypothetical protein LDO26_08945 [Luteimonas sp. BDR2-5]|uniref:hypothetical protein n=1 Tax=Proluteimonas luteida TaxID=2878685 RepID=UPI001E44AFCE|nr:hypothetical protein [Luteimonas sp. BDR2-5]MCD9028334.1 hypothetical protein [Luteimonas sp. BDR2-5]